MAKRIMIQGTASNVGKSLLCTALCRIFAQDGYKVAPFKSQNMALNSAVTQDGLEMGRAQVVQAQAAGIEPSVTMNPILLKPTGDMGSQVIVNGVSQGHMKARAYYAYKKELIPQVQAAFSALEKEYDIIVMEGAGSPAEINLRADDFVNMGLALMTHSPVLLCGDIDRGGVFASLYGTVALVSPQERELIQGLVINKFRGDVSLLGSGLGELEALTQKKILGVIPMLDVDVEDEDSLSTRFQTKKKDALVDIVVLRLPRISNFTDFYPLERYEQVSVRYVNQVQDMGQPDLVIVPGTKDTIGDLQWLQEKKLDVALQEYLVSGGAIIGICGGYQILCQEIRDPSQVERGGCVKGLGLLEGITTFQEEKTRRMVTGKMASLEGVFAPLSGVAVTGYEIHMGETLQSKNPSVLLETPEGACFHDGLCQGAVLGTYLHGVFDKGEMSSALVTLLLERKGMSLSLTSVDWEEYREEQFDLLASAVRESLDMTEIYRIMDAFVSEGEDKNT